MASVTAATARRTGAIRKTEQIPELIEVPAKAGIEPL